MIIESGGDGAPPTARLRAGSGRKRGPNRNPVQSSSKAMDQNTHIDRRTLHGAFRFRKHHGPPPIDGRVDPLANPGAS